MIPRLPKATEITFQNARIIGLENRFATRNGATLVFNNPAA